MRIVIIGRIKSKRGYGDKKKIVLRSFLLIPTKVSNRFIEIYSWILEPLLCQKDHKGFGMQSGGMASREGEKKN